MIIWLASYPKSGNTWMRAVITSLLYTDDGNCSFNLLNKVPQFPEKKYFKDFVNKFNNFDEIKKNWIVAQDKINLDNKIKILKTHQGKYTIGNDNFTNKQNTLATIYVVRDPRTLVKSISNHFTLTINDAYSFLTTPQLIGNPRDFKDKQDGIYQLLGKWNEHYRSWTRNKDHLLLIKYEDLINNPNKELEKIIYFLKKYLKFETNENKNNNIIKTTSFENLKKMEKEGLFKESVIHKKTNKKVNFFHLGPNNQWKNSLDEKIINKINKNFEKEMKEIGYL